MITRNGDIFLVSISYVGNRVTFLPYLYGIRPIFTFPVRRVPYFLSVFAPFLYRYYKISIFKPKPSKKQYILKKFSPAFDNM